MRHDPILAATCWLAATLLSLPVTAQSADLSLLIDPGELPPGLCLPEWSSPFGAEPGLGADSFGFEVYDAVVYDDGMGGGPALYVGGDFIAAGGAPASHLARWDGSTWSDVGGGVNGRVRALAVADFLSGPVLVVGGSFDQAGGVPCENLAQWDGSSWSALSASTNEVVACLYTLKGAPIIPDLVIVGGGFTSIDGVSANRIALYNGGSVFPFGAGFDQQVMAATEHDGAIYVGGVFGASGGAPMGGLARWTGSGWEDVDGGPPGPSSGVTSMVSFDDGSGPALYAAGFSVLPGAFGSLGRWREGVGWDAPGGGVGASIALDLRVWDDGAGEDLYVGGLQMTAGALSQERMLRWDGAAWDSLGSAWDSGSVRTLVDHDDGGGSRLFALGAFWDVGGIAAKGVARWDGAAWSAAGTATGLTDTVHTLCSSDVNGAPALYVGGRGDRLFIPGVPGESGLFGFQGGAWFGLGGIDGVAFNVVDALVAFDDGGGTKLYAGGEFDTIDGVSAENLACWDGVSWAEVGGGTDEAVTALHVWDDGNGAALYVGGGFSFAGGVPANGMARWDGASFSALAGGLGPIDDHHVIPPPTVDDMAAYDDGGGEALYITGRFGSNTLADLAPGEGIARWDGSSWSAVGAGITYASVSGEGRALEVYDDGGGKRLFVGGQFTGAGGLTVQNLAVYDGAWHSLPGGTFNSRVEALQVYDQGGGAFLGSTLLHIGGNFTNVGGNVIVKAARWDGVAFTSIGGGLSGSPAFVKALTVHDTGDGAGPQLALGGLFSHADALLPQPASQLALWGGCWDGVSAWTDLGFALAGVNGDPALVGDGSLALGSVNTLDLSNAASSALAGLLLSFMSTPTPFAGGTLVPVPWLDPIILTLPSSGGIGLTYTVDVCLPPGITLYAQWIIQDGAALAGYALSNAVVGTTP